MWFVEALLGQEIDGVTNDDQFHRPGRGIGGGRDETGQLLFLCADTETAFAGFAGVSAYVESGDDIDGFVITHH
ncbi:MAG: hypothetical protein JNM66_27265 [Bryobacterales bacterium]|nr:hypothetical protein [Bryobacterales bacterium]